MRGLLRFLTVTALVMLIGTAASAIPLVEYLGFVQSTGVYTYQVTLSGTDTLNEFVVNSYCLTATGYSMPAPVNIQGTSGSWGMGRTTWSGNYRGYRWYRGSGTAGWIGQFKLTVTDSHPVLGNVVTKDQNANQNQFAMMVPSVVPEPGSAAAMGTMLLAMGSVLIRKKKT